MSWQELRQVEPYVAGEQPKINNMIKLNTNENPYGPCKQIKDILKDRERTIIKLRFGLEGGKPKTQKEIADMMGISRSYVSRIETKAINKLGKEFQEEVP